MCGVVGWVDHTGIGPRGRHVVGEMNRRQAPRGPDGDGLWQAPRAVLGHTRLSVIDIAGGHQPMELPLTEEHRLVLTYNGELYNYRELRAELVAAGHHFSTDSDTEVILRSWAEWGPAAPERFNGIFAFAVWDTRTETLWLVRDRLGVKPLHYHQQDSGLIFASELKGVLAHPNVPTQVDEDGLRLLLVPLVRFPGATPYRGVTEVLPGEIIEFNRDGLRRSRYWDLREVISRAPSRTVTDVVDELRSLLFDTVARQVVADVPVSTFLSGGLDSSVISAIAARSPESPVLQTFSVDFSDAAGIADSRSALDRRYAREAADHIGSRHSNVVLDAGRLSDPAVRDATVAAYDVPNGCFGDLQMSLYLLCREISDHATVALSGEAADEILGGYRWFQDPTAFWSDTFPWIADSPAHGFLHQRARATVHPDLAEKLRLDEFVADEYQSVINSLPGDSQLNAADRRHRETVYLAVAHFLPMLLDRSDRLSMASGLEVRVPFCDHRIAELLVTQPPRVHNAGGREKGVLRDAAKNLLPPAVLERQKSPFPSSPDPDYSHALATQVADVVAEPPAGLADLFAPDLLSRSAIAGSARSDGLVSNFEGEIILNYDSWFRQYRPHIVG